MKELVPKRLPYLLLAVSLAGALLALAACNTGTSGKATTPTEVMNSVEAGMTQAQVLELVDQEYFINTVSFAVVNFARLEAEGDTLVYEAFGNNNPLQCPVPGNTPMYGTDDEQKSPYYGWLLFGLEGKEVDPALIGFEAGSDAVVLVFRLPFEEAKDLVERQCCGAFR
ncbi:MAG: hypothetical protein U9Q17_00740 [Chloroflexota bacterium]|nr:hypothetical protein [Chloroflexota bacterium]